MYDYKSSLFRVVRRARRALLAPRISHANLILAHFFHVTHDGLTVKPRPNDRNRSTQHIATLLAQYLQAPAKRSQHFDATYRNIVGRNMLRAFGHPVATCCDMLGVENRTSAHALAQHCCTNLAKPLQHHATSTNIAWKIWPVSNLTQQCCDMLRWNVVIVWRGLKRDYWKSNNFVCNLSTREHFHTDYFVLRL